MKRFRKGDMVGRISYNKDVIFEITNILKSTNKGKIYILKGITKRIEADSPESDLEIIDKRILKEQIQREENKIIKRIHKCLNSQEYDNNNNNKNKNSKYSKNYNGKRSERTVYTGKILHLDGDRRYSDKSLRYYKSLGLNAIVKNIPENKQASLVKGLLDKYQPDILIITGHDGMIKKEVNFNDIYNYRNSKHFINTVNAARRWDNPKAKELSIFAGACQSFYEAIMMAGANFASSPRRIMIDFIDPLVVAEKIALTDSTKYITISDIEEDLRDGRDGIDGIGSKGKSIIKQRK